MHLSWDMEFDTVGTRSGSIILHYNYAEWQHNLALHNLALPPCQQQNAGDGNTAARSTAEPRESSYTASDRAAARGLVGASRAFAPGSQEKLKKGVRALGSGRRARARCSTHHGARTTAQPNAANCGPMCVLSLQLVRSVVFTVVFTLTQNF